MSAGETTAASAGGSVMLTGGEEAALLQAKEVTSPCPADLAREAAEALCRSLLDSAA